MIVLTAELQYLNMKNKFKHGGPRKGAGRPAVKEPTVVMRIPLSKVDVVKKVIHDEFVIVTDGNGTTK
jgi:hypothetical protein